MSAVSDVLREDRLFCWTSTQWQEGSEQTLYLGPVTKSKNLETDFLKMPVRL